MPPVIEVAKVQLRRGPEADLPTALDVGEIAMTTDTSRLFMGTDPVAGTPNFGRATFPFTNTEVLTENSIETNQAIFDAQYRWAASGYFTSLPLAPNDPTNPNDWQALLLDATPDGIPSGPFLFNLPGGSLAAAALVTYFCYNGGTPVRAGRLTMLYADGALPPIMSDDAVGSANPAINPITGDPNVAYDLLVFKTVVTSTGVGLMVRNLTGAVATMALRVDSFSPTATPAAVGAGGNITTLVGEAAASAAAAAASATQAAAYVAAVSASPTGNLTIRGSIGIDGPTGPTWSSGVGAPTFVAPVAALYSREDGGLGTRLYVSAGGGLWNAVAGV